MGLKLINRPCDWVFNVLNVGAHESTWTFQLFLCVLNVTLSAWPIICYFLYSADVHSCFWLGTAPQLVSLMVPLVLLGMNGGVQVFLMCKAEADNARIGCFMLFTLLGSILLGASIYITVLAEGTAQDLVHECGSTPLTSRVEHEWQRLDKFYGACDPKRKMAVTACPGFEDEFPGKQKVLVSYLETLEKDFECVGFCQFWAKPIFMGDAASPQDPLDAPRCASALGMHLHYTAHFVGGPISALGIVLLLVGFCLAGYNGL